LNLNGPSIKSLIELQKKKRSEDNYYFNYNRFLSFALALHTKKQTVLSSLVKELKIKDEELNLYINTLKEEELISAEDIKLLKKASTNIKSKDFSNEIEEIITHLNHAADRNFRISKDTQTRIKNLLISGKYNVSDFKKVNVYFTKIWGSNPEMSKYLRPATLYNTKFETRLEEADMFFEELNKYEKSIQKICTKFHTLISMEVYPKDKLIASETQIVDDFCSELPLNLQTSIIHWLKLGYSDDQIIQVIEVTIDHWSKKPELAKHISISKILDQKFPERAAAVKRILESKTQEKALEIFNRIKMDILLYGNKQPNYKKEIRNAISNIGGWNKLRNATEKEMEKLEKEFIEEFNYQKSSLSLPTTEVKQLKEK